ncbi:hypothetical protein ACQBAU_03055 [Propionibacteriaceae bacterium Y2011]|uniref:hypothetical protein n=1 Tax=Microlunatus sp. Y2014 TaxID=3418488 RepID=UPI003B48DE89
MAGIRPNHISRRALLGGVAGAVGVAGLAACGPSGGEGGEGGGEAGNAGAAVETPTFKAFEGLSPDLPGNDQGVIPGYFNYPEPIERDGYPLPEIEPFSIMLQANPPAEAPEQNRNYQQLFTAMGTSFETIFGGGVTYTDKFQVTMAGNDLPDIVQMIPTAKLPQLLEKNFSDLSDILGGDGVLEYPALANIQTAAWGIPQVDGRLWGITKPSPSSGRVMTSRGDILARKGIDPSPQLNSGEDFVALFTELTDRKNNEFALGSDPTEWLLQALYEMQDGGPNGWRKEADGTFTSEVASPQLVRALEEGAKMVKDGLIHPQSFSDPGQNAVWFSAGTTALYLQSFVGWGGHSRSKPEWNVGNVVLPKWDGGGTYSMHKSGGGYYAYMAFKKQESEKRLRELLKIADYVASPFGTTQYLDLVYGTPGYTYEMKDGNPQSLPDTSKFLVQGLTYLGGNGNSALFVPGNEEKVTEMHTYLSEHLPNGVEDDSAGLYSETDSGENATWTAKLKEAKRAVMSGEKPISEWETTAAEWKAEVGDKIAEEYAEAAAAQ